MIRKTVMTLGAVLSLGLSPAHAADSYWGLAVGQSFFQGYDGPARTSGTPAVPVAGASLDAAFAGKLYGGLQINDVMPGLPLLAEVAYFRLGEHELSDSGSNNLGKLNVSALNLSLGIIPYENAALNLKTWIKAGYYNGDTHIRTTVALPGGNSLATTQNTTGASAGLGAAWMLRPDLGLSFDLDMLFGVDTTGSSSENDANLLLASIGLRFGGGAGVRPTALTLSVPASAPAAAPPAPAPAIQQEAPIAAAPVPPPPPAAAATPAVPVPPPPKAPVSTEPVTLVLPGAALRSQPTMQAAQVRPVNPGTPVKTVHKITNASGVWCFVETAVGNGWIRESELTTR